jgi:hypothetical protein
MRIAFLIFLFGFSCTDSPKPKDYSDDSKNVVADSTTPQPVIKSEMAIDLNVRLQAEGFGDWTVVNDSVANWPKDMFDYFISGKRQADVDYPYITKGEFNGDSLPDWAALVTNKAGDFHKVAIFLHNRKVQMWDDDVRGAALSTYPKTELGDIYGKTIQMKAQGINLEFFEKSSWVLYWDGNKFRKAWTGD